MAPRFDRGNATPGGFTSPSPADTTDPANRVIAPPDVLIDLSSAWDARRARVAVAREVLDGVLEDRVVALTAASRLWDDLRIGVPVSADTGWSGPARRMFDTAVNDLVGLMGRVSDTLAESASDTARSRDDLRRAP